MSQDLPALIARAHLLNDLHADALDAVNLYERATPDWIRALDASERIRALADDADRALDLARRASAKRSRLN